MPKTREFFTDIPDKGVPETLTEGEADFEKFLREELLAGGLIDDRYVNEVGEALVAQGH